MKFSLRTEEEIFNKNILNSSGCEIMQQNKWMKKC